MNRFPRLTRHLATFMLALAVASRPYGSEVRGSAGEDVKGKLAHLAALLGVQAVPVISDVTTRPKYGDVYVGYVREVEWLGLTMSFDAKSGRLISVSDDIAHSAKFERDRVLREAGVSLGPRLVREDVLEEATKWAEKLGRGVPEGCELERVECFHGVWYVAWKRRIGGYLFEEEGIHVHLCDATGDLWGFSDTVTEATCDTTPRVSEDAAGIAARAAGNARLNAEKQGAADVYRLDLIEAPNLVIVHPNYKWTDLFLRGEWEPSFTTGPRLVWEFNFRPTYIGPATVHAVPFLQRVWIDAVTGEYVGGG